MVGIMVKPYQQEVTLNVTLHKSGIIACEHVRIVLGGNWCFGLEEIEDRKELCHFFGDYDESVCNPS